jgi:hypothetical protein
MSIDIVGFNKEDARSVGDLSIVASALCAGQGVEHSEAYGTGTLGGEYAARLAFTALRQMGIIPPEGIDKEVFTKVVQDIALSSLNP